MKPQLLHKAYRSSQPISLVGIIGTWNPSCDFERVNSGRHRLE